MSNSNLYILRMEKKMNIGNRLRVVNKEMKITD